MEEAVREGLEESPWERVVAGVALGGPRFVRKARRWLAGDRREQPAVRGLQERASFEQVVRVVEELKGESWRDFRDRYGDWGRDLALCLAQRHCGLRLRELGVKVGGIDYTSVALGVKRLRVRAGRDAKLARVLQRAERQIVKMLNR